MAYNFGIGSVSRIMEKNWIDSSVTTRIQKLDEIHKEFTTLVHDAVSMLQYKEGRIFVAERVYKLGSVTIKPLEDLFETSQDEDLRTIVAIILLKLGVTTRVDWLLQNISREKDHLCLIANTLAKANLAASQQVIIQAFASTDIGDLNTLLCLADAIQILNLELPDATRDATCSELQQRLSTVDLEDFDFIAKSLVLLQYLNFRIDSNLVQRLAVKESNTKLLNKYGYNT
jgi:hypothetical protein